MDLTIGEWYLIIINVIGFFLCLISIHWRRAEQSGRLEPHLLVIDFLCGTLGVVLATMIFDRKRKKENMLTWVGMTTILIMQIAVVLMKWIGFGDDGVNLAFWRFFWRYRPLLYYLIIVNIITFCFYWSDKRRADRNLHRIQIVTLLDLAFIGGSLGALFGMQFLRHKTRTPYFTIGIPLIILMQAVVFFVIMNI